MVMDKRMPEEDGGGDGGGGGCGAGGGGVEGGGRGGGGTACGLWGFRPSWLQRFATPKGFMLVYGFLGTVQSMSFIYFIVSLTTMERRFKIPSKTTGIMLSGNELSQILLALFLSYFGGQRNRPRWIAWGVAISAVSCFILALPHFIYGPGEEALGLTKEFAYSGNITTVLGRNVTSKVATVCADEQRPRNCDEDNLLGENSLLPIVLVFLSQFVLGIGNTLYYSLGNTYMDDNTKKVKTAMMLGYSSALRMLGPAFGFVLGPLCLSLFIDPSLTPLITKDDPRWYGAWWLGWLIIGFLMLVFAGLVGLFPKHLPKKVTSEDFSLPQYPKLPPLPSAFVDEAPLNKVILDNADDKPTIKELPIALKRLLKNKILMSNILSAVFYILGSSAYITYMAKYLEVLYSTSSANSTNLLGPAVLIGMVLGFLISGWFISSKKPHPRYLLFWNVIMGTVYLMGEFSYIFFDCELPAIESQLMNGSAVLSQECNSVCSCDAVTYEPVCHRPTNQVYFSACHAGCSERLHGSQAFRNCSCLPEMNSSWIEANPSNASLAWDITHAGACARDCRTGLILFTAVSTIINILGSSGRIGNILVNYRCVEERDKSFAQGLLLLLVSLCALIPGPIVYGAIMDATCLEWNGGCGGRANCALYDRDKFRLWVNSAAMGFTFIGVLLDVLVWYWGQDLDIYGDAEEAASSPEKNRDSAYS